MEEINIWWKTQDKWSALSNLAPRSFLIGERHYFSVEHCYQSWKSGAFDAETYALYKMGGVKIIGKLPVDHKKSHRIMLKTIRISLEQNEDILGLLLETGDAMLTHKQDNGYWREAFPEILMRLRSSFRNR